MALIKLYETPSAVTLYGTETLYGYPTAFGYYLRRHDCVVFNNYTFQSTYKVYRDGTFVRVCQGDGGLYSMDHDADQMFYHNIYGVSGGQNAYLDPISLRQDYSKIPQFTYTGLSRERMAVWKGVGYRISGSTVTKYNMAGTSIGTFTLTGSITPFTPKTWAITKNNILVAIDDNNGTYGVARFYDLYAGTNLYTSTFNKASNVFIDTEHDNIWSIDATTKRMAIWSFQIAPTTFSAITMGANRCRYREDALSVTLTGSNNEPVFNWPVSWSLSTSEGHLEKNVTLTNASGVATNKYCGPGVSDYVGGSQTITVTTGY